MGLFDWVRCSAPLDDRVGPQDIFQCKDLDCCMETYWVDPAGHLWQLDESGTYDIVEEDPEDVLKARENREWLPPFHPVPNGNHGKVVPHRLTRTICIYPSDWRSKLKDKLHYSDWPEYELTFRDGKLILVQTIR
jgi:hypothetical protein